MNWKQFLTEKVLGECWHSSSLTIHNDTSGQCKKCGTMLYIIGGANRTFDNRNDLMDLYAKIEKDGKWSEYDGEDYAVLRWIDCETARHEKDSDYDAWLFCLNGKDYENRCKMVADFYGWNEQRDPVIDKNSGAYGDN